MIKATHYCRTCGAEWKFWPSSESHLPHDSWSLVSNRCFPCCDNVPMGSQIAEISARKPTDGNAVMPSAVMSLDT